MRIFRLDVGQTLKPGYYWARNGNWEIIFVYGDGIVDARGNVQSLGMSELYRRCELAGPIEPPDDLESHQRWAMSQRDSGVPR
jgi:hypothetical protein